MRVFQHSDPEALATRSHPWTTSVGDSDHRYYDFKLDPSLIRTSLEGFSPWEAYPAIERHYTLVEWLNGARSRLESNDCAFTGPAANTLEGMPMRLQCSGRLMVLFRELRANTDAAGVHALTQAFARAVSEREPDFDWGAVGATIVPVLFHELAGPAEDQHGEQLMISFWAWGDTEPETMANLDRTIGIVAGALREVGGLAADPTNLVQLG